MSQLFLALIVSLFAWGDVPFWKAKDKVYARVQNREIIVSVKEMPAESPFKKRLAMSGAGQLDTPCSFAFSLSEDFTKVAAESGYMENIRYDQATGVLAARISAYGYKADTEIEIRSRKPDSAEPFHSFEVRKGPLSGLKGRFTYYEAAVKNKRCDVGMDGNYGYDRFPLPQFFLRFGMEVMFQRMAARLRGYAEGLYGKTESP